MCKKMLFSDTILKNLPTVGGGNPPPARSLRSLAGTAVTGIAKGTRGHAPAPFIGVK